MRKINIYQLLTTLLLTFTLCLLAACGGRDELKKGTTEVTEVPTQYDLEVAADKDGQFDFDGATLAPEDLRGHIRYLNENNKPVKRILLKPGEKQKIKNLHIAELASIARDLKLEVYVRDDDGHLKVIKIVE